MALSHFQRRKTTLAFYLFDDNKDGVVEKSDILRIGERIAKAAHATPGTHAQPDLTGVFEAMWTSYWAPADRDKSGKVTIDEFLRTQEWVHANTTYEDHERLVGSMFTAVDRGRDGKIDLQEYAAFVEGYGLGPSAAADAFKRMDLDGDGHISMAEWAKLMWGYYRSDDKSDPGNWIFGAF